MITLQVAIATTTTWRNYLQDGNQIAQILGTVMIIIYVIYTYKTFRQIKKQTDYQQDAYLRVDSTIVKELAVNKEVEGFRMKAGKIIFGNNTLSEKYIHKELPLKMKGILQPIFKFDDNLFEGNYYTVSITNYGKTEVNKISLKLIVEILISKELRDSKMLRAEEQKEINIELNEIIGRDGGQIQIPLLSTASFPLYSIVLNGYYTDVRNKKYSITPIRTVGENTHFQKSPSS